MFVGLNPSTADESRDDPTVRRCIQFAKSWNFSRLILVNLFAYRATHPEVLLKVSDPIGTENDSWIDAYVAVADLCVVAWGTRGSNLGRDTVVLTRLKNPMCFGRTLSGSPKHPLYLPGRSRLHPFLA